MWRASFHRPSRLREEVGHGVDFSLGPEGAASNHPVEHAFPRPPVLPNRVPHADLVALEALPRQDLLAGTFGGRLRRRGDLSGVTLARRGGRVRAGDAHGDAQKKRGRANEHMRKGTTIQPPERPYPVQTSSSMQRDPKEIGAAAPSW